MKRPKLTDFTETIYRADAYKYTQAQEKYIDYLEEKNQQLTLSSVIHWVALKSNIKPNEDTEECLVKYEDGKVRTALFSQEDFRFYNSMNSQDITEQIKYYCDLPK